MGWAHSKMGISARRRHARRTGKDGIMNTLPGINELASMWPMWLVAGIFAAAWRISVNMERRNEYLWLLKCESHTRHKAHMEASR